MMKLLLRRLQRHLNLQVLLKLLSLQKQLIKGNELILTTGVILKDNEQGFLQFVQQLSDLDVAGLCIELGMYIEVIPESVIILADSLDFPLIVFQEVVPFIGITQDLHTEIIHQQYDVLRQLEDYSQKINNYVLKVNDKVIAKVSKYTC